MKKITHIKDSEGNIYKIAEEPVIFGKALPQHPLAGKRYFFNKDLNIKFGNFEEANEFSEWFKDLYKESSFLKNYFAGCTTRAYTIGYGDDKQEIRANMLTIELTLYDASQYTFAHKKLILNIPENFDLYKFFIDESYFKSIVEIANNYTGDTASPNFKIINGEVEYIENVIKFQSNQILKSITKPILFVWKKRRHYTSNRKDELSHPIEGHTYRKKIWYPGKEIPRKKFIATLFNYKCRKGKKYFGRSFRVCLKHIGSNDFLSLLQ